MQLSHKRGFTLLEILIVLSLIAVMAGLMIGNLDALIEAAEFIPPEQRFRDIAAEARLLATEQRATMALSYDAAQGRFVLSSASIQAGSAATSAEAVFMSEVSPSRAEYRYADLNVEFFPQLSVDESQDASERMYADEPVAALEFSPTGVATPALIQFSGDDRETTELTLDAFSAGPMIERDAIALP